MQSSGTVAPRGSRSCKFVSAAVNIQEKMRRRALLRIIVLESLLIPQNKLHLLLARFTLYGGILREIPAEK